jgi:hypothetical protein
MPGNSGSRRPAILGGSTLLAIMLAAGAAHAALLGTCTVTVLSGGTLGHDAAIDTLGSREAGGSAAQVQIKANSVVCTVLGLLDCYRVSAPPPAAFGAYPPGGDAGVAFSSSYSIDGGPGIAGTTQTEVLNGTYSVAVDLTADRTSGIFPAGAYQAQVTVRCE